jgi:hypothetical protein
MVGHRFRSIAFVVATAALGALASGCYAEEEEPAPVYAEGYQPMYYDGYVVYYDDGGRPYYYNNGAVVWVPPTAAVYASLVDHYRVYGPAYHRWYGHYGYRYHGYHRVYRR